MKFYRIKKENDLDKLVERYGEDTTLIPVDIYITQRGDLVFIEKDGIRMLGVFENSNENIGAYISSDLKNEMKIQSRII